MDATAQADLPCRRAEQKEFRVNNKPALSPQNLQPETGNAPETAPGTAALPGRGTGADLAGDLVTGDQAAKDLAVKELAAKDLAATDQNGSAAGPAPDAGVDGDDADDLAPGSPRLRKPDGTPRGPRAAAALAERKTKRAADLDTKRGDLPGTRRPPRQTEPGGKLALVPGSGAQRAARASRAMLDAGAPLPGPAANVAVPEGLAAQPPALLQTGTHLQPSANIETRPADRRLFDPYDDPGPAPAVRGKPARGKPARGKPSPDAASFGQVAETAGPAVVRRRHYGVLLSSFLFIWFPVALAAWYLWTHAVDQYESRVGFAVRTEEAASPYDLLGALGGGSGSANDMDVLNEFIRSQQLVEKLDGELDLRHKFGLPDGDPLMSLPDQVTVEALVDFWRRMVIINYDSSTGLMDLQVFAFTPEDAQTISRAVLSESGLLVNQMSAIAREDTTRFTKEALEVARLRMSDARAAITEFRIRNQIVDPTADIAAQMSVLASLNQQLAAAQVELDTLISGNVTASDPRAQTASRRIAAIEGRIAQERTKLGVGEDGDLSGFATLFGDYERLKVDVTFAEGTYLAALNAYDGAETEAQRKSRYLAAFVEPTLAEASTAPNRPLLLALVFAIGFFTWAILVLIYYALRDRR